MSDASNADKAGKKDRAYASSGETEARAAFDPITVPPRQKSRTQELNKVVVRERAKASADDAVALPAELPANRLQEVAFDPELAAQFEQRLRADAVARAVSRGGSTGDATPGPRNKDLPTGPMLGKAAGLPELEGDIVDDGVSPGAAASAAGATSGARAEGAAGAAAAKGPRGTPLMQAKAGPKPADDVVVPLPAPRKSEEIAIPGVEKPNRKAIAVWVGVIVLLLLLLIVLGPMLTGDDPAPREGADGEAPAGDADATSEAPTSETTAVDASAPTGAETSTGTGTEVVAPETDTDEATDATPPDTGAAASTAATTTSEPATPPPSSTAPPPPSSDALFKKQP